MAKEGLVPRPAKKSEYELRFATAGAQKGWRDLVATMRNVMADTWDFLTTTPATRTPTNYPLHDKLGTIHRGGKTYERWQHKPNHSRKAGRTPLLHVPKTPVPDRRADRRMSVRMTLAARPDKARAEKPHDCKDLSERAERPKATMSF